MPRRWPHFCCLIMAIAIASCAPTITPTPEPPTQTPTDTPVPPPTPTAPYVPRTRAADEAEQSALRFVHSVEGLGSIDVYAEMLRLTSDLGFGQTAGDAPIVAGTYLFRLIPANGDPMASSWGQALLTLDGGSRYTLLLSGRADAPEFTLLADDTSPLEPGHSRIAVIAAAPNAEPVAAALESGTEVAAGLTFGQQSEALTIPVGSSTLRVSASGQTAAEISIDFVEAKLYTIVITGTPDSGAIQVSSYETTVPGLAQLRIVQALAPDLGPMDFYVGEDLVATEQVFGTASDLISIPNRLTTITVMPTGSGAADRPLLAYSLTPATGDTITFMATGSAQSSRVVVHTEQRTPLDEGQELMERSSRDLLRQP